MNLRERRSPHEAGSVSKLGGDASGNHSLLARWNLLGAATRDPRLSRGDVAVLHSIAGRIGDDGTAWPGFGRLASDTGLHRSTVARSITRLDEIGYLDRESGGQGKSNRYRLGSRVDAPSTHSADATTTSGVAATSSGDATSRADATGLVAPTRLGVVAPMRPELDPLNSSKEPVQTLRARKPKSDSTADRFSEFCEVYPRREAKPAAEKSWRRQKLDAVADAIIADVQARVADAGQWKGVERRYVPLPATYLNGRRWEDDWAPTVAAEKGRLLRDSRSDGEIAAANEAALARFGGAP